MVKSMTKISINDNNQAIKFINDVISNYEEAISTITSTNDNDRTREIVSLINQNTTNLKDTRSKIYNMNSRITSEMNKLKNGSE